MTLTGLSGEIVEDLLTLAARRDTGDTREIANAALHEAGHAVFCMSIGLRVCEASIEPDDLRAGHVIHAPLPYPAQIDCAPDSSWVKAAAKVSLAGDRAARLLDPLRQTAGGGTRSDAHQAFAILDAVHQPEAVAAALDQLCDELDQCFAQPILQAQVLDVARALLTHGHLKELDLRALLGCVGRCGAYNRDLTSRCTADPHSLLASHHARHWDRPTGQNLECWDSEFPNRPDRLPKSKWTAPRRDLMRIIDPQNNPPRRRGPALANQAELQATIDDPRTSAAAKLRAQADLLKLMRQRVAPETRVAMLPAPASLGAGDATRREEHRQNCSEAVRDRDGDWCTRCAFELRSPSAERKSFIYLIERLVTCCCGLCDAYLIAAGLDPVSSAAEAAVLLRNNRDLFAGELGYRVRRYRAPSNRKNPSSRGTSKSSSGPTS